MTGGLASGKSLVANVLQYCGADVVDADEVSRFLTKPGSPLLLQMAEAWGADIIGADGELDRALLAQRVFGNPQEVERLNRMSHPPIMREIRSRLRQSNAKVAVLMAPLLLEAGGINLVDELWVVVANPRVRILRAMERDKCSAEEAQARIDAQLSDHERVRLARVIIPNEGFPPQTIDLVQQEWSRLLERISHAAGR